MSNLLLQQLDFIYVVYGSAFLTLAVMAGALRKLRSPDLHWRWLQLFGLLHGLYEWSEALMFALGQNPQLESIRQALLLASFLALFEFARRGTTASDRISIWFYAPILACAAASLYPGAASLIRYGVGLPAALLASWVLWSFGKKETSNLFRGASLLLFLYALLTGAIPSPAPFGPARWLNSESFLRFTGIPVQLIRTLIVYALAILLWQIAVRGIVRHLRRPTTRIIPFYIRHLLLVLFIALALGWFLTEQLGVFAENNQKDRLMDRAQAVATSLNPELLLPLSGLPEQEMTPSHRRVVRTLTDIKKISPDVAQVYLYGLRKGRLVFYACSMCERPESYLPAGQIYEGETTKQDFSFFTNAQPFVTGPYRDQRGEWVSAIVPALFAGNGKGVELALGMDIPARAFLNDIRFYRMFGLALTMALSLLLLDFFSRQRQVWVAAQDLASSEEDLRHISEELERRVVERTSELAEANQALQQEVAAHRKAELKFRTLTEQLPAITYTVELIPKPKTVFISQQVETLLGYTQKEWLENPALWVDTIHPSERARVLMEIERKNITAEPFDIECRHLSRAGKTLWFRNTARYQTDEAGKPTHVHGVMTDITDRIEIAQELRETADRYRLLFEHSPVGIFHYDQYLILTRSNHRFAQILKSSQENLLGLDLRKLKDRSVLPALEDALQGQMGHYEGLYRATTSETEVWINMNTGPVLDRDGKTIGGVGIVEDTSEHRRSEDERNRHQKLESLGLLAGGIAHDFNNLLTSVLANISLLKHPTQPLAMADREILSDAELAALRARDLTQQLLTFSKGGAPVKRMTRLDKLIRETTSFALRGSSSKYELQIDPDLWPADVDAAQIAQVIQNLVINADQAMQGGGSILIRAHNLRLGKNEKSGLDAGDYVRIQVVDNGIGIPAKNLEHIFDPYFTTKQNGSGLGLTTSYSIINKHRGRVSVQSDVGKGSQFNVYLPATEGGVVPEGATAPERVAAQPEKIRVLIMDDEPSIRAVTTRILSKAGYEVQTTTHGAEAVAAFVKAREEGHPFGVVILDLTIPGGMGGREAFLHLQAIDPAVRALVASGYSDQTLDQTLALGFSGMVPKPFTVNELLKAVGAVAGVR